MAQITLRGMDPALEREIRRIARKSGKSLNRVILDMIYQLPDFNRENKKSPADSLRKLAGGWTRKEVSEITKSIKCFEQIDEELWR